MKFIKYGKPLKARKKMYVDNKEDPTDIVVTHLVHDPMRSPIKIPDNYVEIDRLPIFDMEIQYIVGNHLVDVETGKQYNIGKAGINKLLSLIASKEIEVTDNHSFKGQFTICFPFSSIWRGSEFGLMPVPKYT